MEDDNIIFVEPQEKSNAKQIGNKRKTHLNTSVINNDEFSYGEGNDEEEEELVLNSAPKKTKTNISSTPKTSKAINIDQDDLFNKTSNIPINIPINIPTSLNKKSKKHFEDDNEDIDNQEPMNQEEIDEIQFNKMLDKRFNNDQTETEEDINSILTNANPNTRFIQREFNKLDLLENGEECITIHREILTYLQINLIEFYGQLNIHNKDEIDIFKRLVCIINRVIGLTKAPSNERIPVEKRLDMIIQNFNAGENFDTFNIEKFYHEAIKDKDRFKKPYLLTARLLIEKASSLNLLKTETVKDKLLNSIDQFEVYYHTDFFLLMMFVTRAMASKNWHSKGVLMRMIEDESQLLSPEIQDAEKVSLVKSLREEVFEECLKLALRRGSEQFTKNTIYKPIYTKEGYFTQFYEVYIDTIDEFVYHIIDKSDKRDDFLSSRSCVTNIISYIKNQPLVCKDDSKMCNYLPIIEISRDLLSFKNGVFNLDTDTFYPYNNKDPPTSYFPGPIKTLDPNSASFNYLDYDFQHFHDRDWREIDTPTVDRILNHQGHLIPSLTIFRKEMKSTNKNSEIPNGKSELRDGEIVENMSPNKKSPRRDTTSTSETEFSEEDSGFLEPKDKRQEKSYIQMKDYNETKSKENGICLFEFTRSGEWISALLGRGFRKLKLKDKWDTVLYIIGWAGTGKSILYETLAEVYPVEKRGTIGNNTEKNFALGGLFSKWIVIAPELQRNANLDQGEFLQIAAGEFLEIKKKYADKFSIKWESCIYIAGNEIVKRWRNTANNLYRRLVIVYFKNFVQMKDSDPNLRTKLKNESPNIIQKWNRAYLESVMLYGDKHLLTVLPENLKNSTEEALASTHPLSMFLKETSLYTIISGTRTSFTVFKTVFENWFLSNGNQVKYLPRWTEDFYEATFKYIGVEVIKDSDDSNPLGPCVTQYLSNIKLHEKTIQQYGSSNYGNKFNNNNNHGSNKKITSNDNEED